jgi:hypothetical protein
MCQAITVADSPAESAALRTRVACAHGVEGQTAVGFALSGVLAPTKPQVG